MARRLACINNLPIREADRKYHWPLGRRGPSKARILTNFGPPQKSPKSKRGQVPARHWVGTYLAYSSSRRGIASSRNRIKRSMVKHNKGDRQSRNEGHTFVLVHGGWCGGGLWRYVAPALRERGDVVTTPTPTRLCERRHFGNENAPLLNPIENIACS